MPTWRLSFAVPASAVATFEAAVAAIAPSYTCFEETPGDPTVWRLTGYLEERPDRARIGAHLAVASAATGIAPPEPAIDAVEVRDWLAENRLDFPPVCAGRFYIYGSHVEESPPAGTFPILVDAATAFGSGEHPSTRGCLLALDLLARSRTFRSVLDMGTGSGILAIAAARAWTTRVTGVDIDAESVRVAAFNARRNRVAGSVEVLEAGTVRRRTIARRGPFDLVTANILARPLTAMARDLTAVMDDRATVVLSGLLDRQAQGVLTAYRRHHLSLASRVRLDGWTTLVLRR